MAKLDAVAVSIMGISIVLMFLCSVINGAIADDQVGYQKTMMLTLLTLLMIKMSRYL